MEVTKDLLQQYYYLTICFHFDECLPDYGGVPLPLTPIQIYQGHPKGGQTLPATDCYNRPVQTYIICDGMEETYSI